MSPTKHNTAAPDDPDNRNIIWLLPAGKLNTGIVSVTYKGQSIAVEFHAAKMEVILLLNKLLTSPDPPNLPPGLHRWHSYEELVPRLDDSLQQVQSVRRKVCDINRIFRLAAEAALPGEIVPPLIDTKRGFGVHLHWPFCVLPAGYTPDWRTSA